MFRIARQALVATWRESVPGYQSRPQFRQVLSRLRHLSVPICSSLKMIPRFSCRRNGPTSPLALEKSSLSCARRCNVRVLGEQVDTNGHRKSLRRDCVNCGRANPALGFEARPPIGRRQVLRRERFRIFAYRAEHQHSPARQASSQPSQTAAPLPAPTPVDVTEDVYEVDVRKQLCHCAANHASIHVIRVPMSLLSCRPAKWWFACQGNRGDKFFEVQTSLNGAHLHGFAAAKYLRPVKVPKAIPVVAPKAAPPTTGIVAVYIAAQAWNNHASR